jgi:hypothetical protein
MALDGVSLQEQRLALYTCLITECYQRDTTPGPLLAINCTLFRQDHASDVVEPGIANVMGVKRTARLNDD